MAPFPFVGRGAPHGTGDRRPARILLRRRHARRHDVLRALVPGESRAPARPGGVEQMGSVREVPAPPSARGAVGNGGRAGARPSRLSDATRRGRRGYIAHQAVWSCRVDVYIWTRNFRQRAGWAMDCGILGNKGDKRRCRIGLLNEQTGRAERTAGFPRMGVAAGLCRRSGGCTGWAT